MLESQEALYSRYLISHNRADRNAAYGIFQMGPGGVDPRPAGMPDDMTNTAKQNGEPAQCLNITCTRK